MAWIRVACSYQNNNNNSAICCYTKLIGRVIWSVSKIFWVNHEVFSISGEITRDTKKMPYKAIKLTSHMTQCMFGKRLKPLMIYSERFSNSRWKKIGYLGPSSISGLLRSFWVIHSKLTFVNFEINGKQWNVGNSKKWRF